MPWQLIMLLQNIFASIYALESRVLAKKYKSAHFQILAVTFLIVYLVFVAYALMHRSSIDTQLGFRFMGQIWLVAAAFTVWTVLTFITLRFVDAAFGTLLTTLNILAVVAISSYFIHEGLNFMQAIGAGFLVLSIVVISRTNRTRLQRHKALVAIILSLLASLCFGAAITGEKYLLNQIGGATYALFGIGAQFIALALLALIYKPSQFRHFKKPQFRNRVLVMGLVRAGAGLLFILSLVAANNASLIGMLSGAKVILTTLLAAILLKELTFIKKKVLASCIACLGVGLMLL